MTLACRQGAVAVGGYGVPEDDAEAVRWYRLAAEQGFAAAQYNMGVMYHEGTGSVQDAVEAIRWYGLAAEQGDPLAQTNLGAMLAQRWYRHHLKAREGPLPRAAFNLAQQDLILAYEWLTLAAGQQNTTAQANRRVLAPWLTPAQLVEAQRLSQEWLYRRSQRAEPASQTIRDLRR